jgi:hypothetical protein
MRAIATATATAIDTAAATVIVNKIRRISSATHDRYFLFFSLIFFQCILTLSPLAE